MLINHDALYQTVFYFTHQEKKIVGGIIVTSPLQENLTQFINNDTLVSIKIKKITKIERERNTRNRNGK